MTAQVLRVFNHEYNALEVAEQEYALAKDHFREVCRYRSVLNAEHNQRFRDALDRQEEARDRYVQMLRGEP